MNDTVSRPRAAFIVGQALALIFAGLLAALPARAQAEPAIAVSILPTGEEHVIGRSALEALPRTEYTTSTVWTENVDTYAGVLLRDLLFALSVDPAKPGGEITLQAIDGYTVTMPFSDITPVAPMVAYHRNDKVMPPREQGPFWLIFPYDSSPAFQTETVYARSIWQVTSMQIGF